MSFSTKTRGYGLVPISLTATVIAGAVIRLWHLGAKSLWYDEAFTVGIVRMSWHDMWNGIISQSNMALYYLLMRGWIQLGDSEWWLRFFTVSLTVVSMAIFALYAKRHFGSAVAVVSTAIVAVFPLHVHYSRDVRSYGLLLVSLAASHWFWTDTMLGGRARSYVGWVGFALAALYSHLFACLIFAAQIVAAVLLPPATAGAPSKLCLGGVVASSSRKLREGRDAGEERLARFRTIARALGVYILGALPLAYCVHLTGASQLSWISYTSNNGTERFFSEITGDARGLLPLILGTFAVGAAVLIRRLAKHGRTRELSLQPQHAKNGRAGDPLAGAAFVIAAFPVVTIVTVSLWRPCLLPRYVLMVVPFLAIAIAWTLLQLPRWLAAPVFVGLLVTCAVGTRNYFHEPTWNDFRGATQLIASNAEPGDGLIAFGNEMRPGLDYYREHRPAGSNFPEFIFPGDSERTRFADLWVRPEVESLDATLRRYDHVWLFLEGSSPVEKQRIWAHFILRRLALQFELKGRNVFSGGQVFEFRRTAPRAFGPPQISESSARLLEKIMPGKQ